MSNIKIRETITAKIAELQVEAKTITDQIVALELASAALSGETFPRDVRTQIAPGKVTVTHRPLPGQKFKNNVHTKDNAPRAKVKAPLKSQVRTPDANARAKTIAFMTGRAHATTIDAVAKRFGLTQPAATQRLLLLVKEGAARRVGRGRYKLNDKTLQITEPTANLGNGIRFEGNPGPV